MGAAMWSTFISIAFTIAGCFALSANVDIVKNTNWVYVETKNQDTGDVFISYLGLRSLVYESQPCDPLGCKDTSFDFLSTSGSKWPNEFIEDGLEDCRAVAFGAAFGAFTTCATLLFALMGTMNRMRSEKKMQLCTVSHEKKNLGVLDNKNPQHKCLTDTTPCLMVFSFQHPGFRPTPTSRKLLA
jgi:hypothetical protein